MIARQGSLSGVETGARLFLHSNFTLQRYLQLSDNASSGGSARRPATAGSRLGLRSAPDPRVFRALPASCKLHLTLHDEGRYLLELGGLLPDRHYRTGTAAQPYLRADPDGRGLLLLGRTALVIAPVV